MTGSVPKVLMTFLEHELAGDRELNDFRSLDALSIINNFLYIVTSEKQVNYKPNSAESTFYHKDATMRQIGIGLLVHQATYNKSVFERKRQHIYTIEFYQRNTAVLSY